MHISALCPAASSASRPMHAETAPIASHCRRASSTSGASSATSNICTAQVLPAVIASMYAVFHGPKGLKAIAERVHRKAARLAEGLSSLGFKIRPESFFDTITVEVGPYQGLIMKNAVDNGVNLRKVGA